MNVKNQTKPYMPKWLINAYCNVFLLIYFFSIFSKIETKRI